MPLQGVQQGGHRHRKVLAALTARSGPHPLQHLPCIVGIPMRPRLPGPKGDRAATARGLHRGRGQPAPGVVPRPARHRDNLVQHLALVLLPCAHVCLRVPRRDLGIGSHRQLAPHTTRASPFRGQSYVRHGKRFAGSSRESSRNLACRQVRCYCPTMADHGRPWPKRANAHLSLMLLR